MRSELTFDAVLAAVDGILELPLKPDEANSSWLKLDRMLDRVLEATRVDPARHRHLSEVLSPLRAAASELARSLSNAKRGGPMRGDWMRLAERDLVKLKDELLALREFMVREADFLRLACLRAQLEGLGRINPEKLFEELHEAGAISERTWALLMAHPGSWQKALRDRELSRQLARISGWLFDLQELRRESRAGVPAPER
jgi:hypothetical protein